MFVILITYFQNSLSKNNVTLFINPLYLYLLQLFWILAVLFMDKSNGCNRSNERCFGKNLVYKLYQREIAEPD